MITFDIQGTLICHRVYWNYDCHEQFWRGNRLFQRGHEQTMDRDYNKESIKYVEQPSAECTLSHTGDIKYWSREFQELKKSAGEWNDSCSFYGLFRSLAWFYWHPIQRDSVAGVQAHLACWGYLREPLKAPEVRGPLGCCCCCSSMAVYLLL